MDQINITLSFYLDRDKVSKEAILKFFSARLENSDIRNAKEQRIVSELTEQLLTFIETSSIVNH